MSCFLKVPFRLIKKRVSGFFLIEVALMMMVSSLLMMGWIRMQKISQYQIKQQLTQKRMETIKQALILYFLEHHTLPLAVNTGKGCYEPEPRHGYVPCEKLNLTADYLKDGFGRPFIYRVDYYLSTTQKDFQDALRKESKYLYHFQKLFRDQGRPCLHQKPCLRPTCFTQICPNLQISLFYPSKTKLYPKTSNAQPLSQGNDMYHVICMYDAKEPDFVAFALVTQSEKTHPQYVVKMALNRSAPLEVYVPSLEEQKAGFKDQVIYMTLHQLRSMVCPPPSDHFGYRRAHDVDK